MWKHPPEANVSPVVPPPVGAPRSMIASSGPAWGGAGLPDARKVLAPLAGPTHTHAVELVAAAIQKQRRVRICFGFPWFPLLPVPKSLLTWRGVFVIYAGVYQSLRMMEDQYGGQKFGRVPAGRGFWMCQEAQKTCFDMCVGVRGRDCRVLT